jgi:hypothetical protein
MSDLAKTSGTELQIPSFLPKGGPTGFENMDNDCISIPFLRLAQSNTPQVSDPDQRISGLEPGMYFNPSTGRVYGSDPSFIILGFFRSWNVWFGNPPDAKFVKTMTPEAFESQARPRIKDAVTPEGKTVQMDPEGNRYQDTRNFFVLSADHPEDGILLYPMTSTGIPASKKWLAKASAIRVKDENGIPGPVHMWSRIWKIKVNFEKSKKGNYFQMNDASDQGWIPASLAPVAQAAFDDAQSYDKERVSAVEKHDDAPDWVNEK